VKPGSRIPVLLRELADEIDAALAAEPKAKRKAGLRAVPKFQVRPTELQRAKAASLLRAKGL
jgi:hypothetical protein